MSWQFTVGVMAKGKAERIVVGAEDALIAALRVKAERPEASIMYVRRLNRRGDTRHPPHTLTRAGDYRSAASRRAVLSVPLERMLN